MMLGERHRHNPTIQIPPWPLIDEDPLSSHHLSPTGNTSAEYSPLYLQEALKALQRYLPSAASDDGHMIDEHHPDSPVDAYSCDQFRMYEFKVRRCARGRSHDWTECPFAHPGEKARRRDPRRYHYSGTACPEFRKGSCKKGDACEYAHGVFECWLHPARYRTQPCKDGVNCRRRVCFFAHTSDQLRVLSGSQGSPPASPPGSESPPVSPMMSRSYNDVVCSLMNMQLGKGSMYGQSWNGGSGYGSPRGSGYLSLPTTPGQVRGSFWDRLCLDGEEEAMERVESGRDIRKRMFEKLSKENSLHRPYADSGPDVEWVSDLLN